MDSYSLADVLNPRDVLYAGHCETFALNDQSTDRSVIMYVDVQSLYPYLCKSKPYPIGHPRCLIGPNLRGVDMNSYEVLIKYKVLPLRVYAFFSCPVTLIASSCLYCAKLVQRRPTVVSVVIHVANAVSRARGSLSSCKKQWLLGMSL